MLELKMVLMNYLQGSKGDTDVETRLMDTGWGRKERVRCMERATWKFTPTYVK